MKIVENVDACTFTIRWRSMLFFGNQGNKIPTIIRSVSLQLTRKMMHSVFVYGTLKRGEPNYTWLTSPVNGHSKFQCKASTTCKYPLVIATKYNIPFLLFHPNTGHFVTGEIFEVDDLMLSKLDILEGHPTFYTRTIDVLRPISEGAPSTANCWVYFLKTFKKHLLDLPMLNVYSSKGPHGLKYTERTHWDPKYKYIDEIR